MKKLPEELKSDNSLLEKLLRMLEQRQRVGSALEGSSHDLGGHGAGDIVLLALRGKGFEDVSYGDLRRRFLPFGWRCVADDVQVWRLSDGAMLPDEAEQLITFIRERF